MLMRPSLAKSLLKAGSFVSGDEHGHCAAFMRWIHRADPVLYTALMSTDLHPCSLELYSTQLEIVAKVYVLLHGIQHPVSLSREHAFVTL